MNGNSMWLSVTRKVHNMAVCLSTLAKVGLAALAVAAGAQSALAQGWSFSTWTVASGGTMRFVSTASNYDTGWELAVSAPFGGDNPNMWQAGDPPIPVTIDYVEFPGHNGTLDFVGGQGLSNVLYEDSTKYKLVGIEAQAFGYSSLAVIRLPDTLERIGSYAFEGSDLTAIELSVSNPAMLTIGSSVFDSTYYLDSITVWGPPPLLEEDSFYGIEYNGYGDGHSFATLYVPSEYSTEWSDYVDNNDIADFTVGQRVVSLIHLVGPTHFTPSLYIQLASPTTGWNWILDWSGGTVGPATMSCPTKGWILDVWVDDYSDTIAIQNVNTEGISNLVLPSSVTAPGYSGSFYITMIDYSAFAGSAITSIQIPGVLTIANGAFENCQTLTDVVFYEDMPEYSSIESLAFSYCSSLTNVTFNGVPPSVFEDEYVFPYCDVDLVVNTYAAYAHLWGYNGMIESGSLSDNTALLWQYIQFGYHNEHLIPLNIVDFGPLTPAYQIYTVTFDGDGVTPTPSSMLVTNTFTYGTLAIVPARSGYAFGGWWTTQATGGDHILASTPVILSGDQTLYARWNAIYTVTFDKNAFDATLPVPSVITVTNSLPYGMLPASLLGGYTFKGWWTDPDNGTQILASTLVSLSANQTLYAHWNDSSVWDWYLDEHYGSYGGSYHALKCDEANWHLAVETDSTGSIVIIGVVTEGNADLRLPVSVTADRVYTITRIEDEAFANKSITSITIPDGIEYIGQRAFDYCYSLTDVEIGSMSPTAEISFRAFADCQALTNVTFKGAAPGDIDLDAFWAVDDCCVLNIYSAYTAGWEDYVSGGTFLDNSAISIFQWSSHGGYLPINILNFVPSTDPSVDGHNGIPGDGDDIIIPGGEVDGNTGYITVPDTSDGSDVTHRDGSELEGGDAPGGSIIINPNIVIRPGEGDDPTINNNGTITVTPGNTIDLDGDGQPPWVVPEDGIYDPGTGTFTPDDPSHPPIPVPPPNLGNLVDALIGSIHVDTAQNVTLTWDSTLIQYGLGTDSILFGKVNLLDSEWTPLSEAGLLLSVVTDTGVVVPATVTRAPGENFHFFKRMVRQP